MPLIDATDAVLAVHQNHGFGHVPGGTGRSWEGPEAVENRRVLGDLGEVCNLDSATHLVKRGRIVPALRIRHLRARLISLSEKRPMLAGPLGLLRASARYLKRR